MSKVVFKNDASESVPAYGVMKVNSVDQDVVIHTVKPTTDGEKLILVNSEVVVAKGSPGNAFSPINTDLWALYDTADGTPALGERWGPKAGSWKLSKDKAGFLVVPMTGGNPPPIAGLVFVRLEVCR